jgi:hypothetical protein
MRFVESVMMSERIELRPSGPGRKVDVPPETWVLLTLAMSGVATLLWIGFFAWANARAVGLF